MSEKPIKLENTEISNFNPSFLEKGQEVIFTLKDSNILDNQNNPNDISIKDNFQLNEIRYEKNTGISIERLNENELLLPNKDKIEIELKDNGQIIDENILLNKFNKIQNKYQNKNPTNKKKFQDEFYNQEELKLLNKKKNRKKNNTLILFDIDINDEENNENNNKEKNEEKENDNDNNDINNILIKKTKKNLFSNEDKEKLDNLFNKKEKNEVAIKKNVINIDENLTDEEKSINNNINNINNINEINNNIKINQDKDNNNYKIIDDYEIFLNNLPPIKNTLIPNQIQVEQKISEKNQNQEKNTPLNQNTIENIISEKDDETTINNNDDEIPLITDEPIIGKGVCVALQIFKNKKMLKNEEEEFGRYHDKKYKNITNETEEKNNKKNAYDNNIMNIKDKDEYYKHKEINIEYRDENGKKLKPKEMARYQALIFHGEKSSVRKREKKLLREKYQVFVQNPNSNKTLNYMNFMKDKNNQAFATLQGKSSFL